jgi:lipid-binding SYLF domain-containing protein
MHMIDVSDQLDTIQCAIRNLTTAGRQRLARISVCKPCFGRKQSKKFLKAPGYFDEHLRIQLLTLIEHRDPNAQRSEDKRAHLGALDNNIAREGHSFSNKDPAECQGVGAPTNLSEPRSSGTRQAAKCPAGKNINMRNFHASLLFTIVGAISASAADETAARLNKAAEVFAKLTESEHGALPSRIASADCIAVIPGFKKGAAGLGIGFGRGFISCRKEGGWSAPAAITLETASVGVQLGGEEIDIVLLSLDKERRSKLLSERFAVGSDASAAWGNGKSAHEDPSAQIIFYGHTKGAFAGFGLDGATLKRDQSGDKALYGKDLKNSDIVDGTANTPSVAEPFVDKLSQMANR